MKEEKLNSRKYDDSVGSKIRRLIHGLDFFNWKHCNSEELCHLITEVKEYMEELETKDVYIGGSIPQKPPF